MSEGDTAPRAHGLTPEELRYIHEALYNLRSLARPHFSDDIQKFALSQATDALEMLDEAIAEAEGRTPRSK